MNQDLASMLAMAAAPIAGGMMAAGEPHNRATLFNAMGLANELLHMAVVQVTEMEADHVARDAEPQAG